MLLQEIVRLEIKQQASFCALLVCGLKAQPSGVHYHQIFFSTPTSYQALT